MEFERIDTQKRYAPKLTSAELCDETADQYCARIALLLPHFPAEVLKQWFFEHWTQIDDYAWLGYERLKFEKQLWTSQEVMNSGIRDNKSVQIDHSHFDNGITHAKIERIAEHFQAYRTWPVPPIFLANPSGDITFAGGWHITAPYHLLEGHHRSGLFWSFFKRETIGETHAVWIAQIDDAWMTTNR